MMLAPAPWVDRLRELSGFNFAHTANANPITCAVGNAVLDIIEEEKLSERAERMGRYLWQKLDNIRQRYTTLGDIRGRDRTPTG
jgi:4-aminobutyrate aminotransferase-like enzyme